MRRMPAVAGQFYSGSAAGLRREVESFFDTSAERERALAIMSPHAGLVYSGHVAGALYSSIETPETFLLIGPNHTGLGAQVSMMGEGEWEIPGAVFSIDTELAAALKHHSELITDDTQAHMHEHSLEVQLPFIAHLAPDSRIVPMTIGRASLSECKALGQAVAKAIRECGRRVLIVASTDMSHYMHDSDARAADSHAISQVLELTPAGLYDTVINEHITMCGFIPTTIMLYASLELGAGNARLVKYATSGEINRDLDRVVGYAGIIIS